MERRNNLANLRSASTDSREEDEEPSLWGTAARVVGFIGDMMPETVAENLTMMAIAYAAGSMTGQFPSSQTGNSSHGNFTDLGYSSQEPQPITTGNSFGRFDLLSEALKSQGSM